MTQDADVGSETTEHATIAGGCFWCLEAIFQKVPGVIQILNGYSGGHVSNPTYQQVCSDTTGHAESVQVTFDPDIIGYTEILEIFFSIHDPTTPNRQGNDIGHSYRSVIFYHSAEQQDLAQEMVVRLLTSKSWPDPIVTEIVPLTDFYRAEDYHQNYFLNNSDQPYCQVIIEPKLRKFLSRTDPSLDPSNPSQ